MRNCSLHFWSEFYVQDNETTQYLLENGDQFSGSTHSKLVNILTFLVAAFIILPNFLMIVGIKNTNKKLNFVKRLFIYLSSTDSMMGLVSLPYYGVSVSLKLSCNHVSTANSIGLCSIIVGTQTISVISTLRLLALIKPFYRIKFKIVFLYVVFQLLTALLSAAVNWTANVYVASLYPAQCIFNGLLITMHVFISMLCNVRSILFIRNQKSRSSSQIGGNLSIRRHAKAVGRLSRASAVIALCYLPSSLFYVYFGCMLYVRKLKITFFLTLFDMADMSYVPAIICPGVTAIVYVAWNNRIKSYYKDLICCRSKRNSVEDASKM